MAKILIVDDSVIMRRNIKIILEKAEHEVVAEAVNGKEAYNQYKKYLPDLVIMDVTMPVMSGKEAVKNIIDAFPFANIIMISDIEQRNLVFEALENGAKHYIIKPIEAENILRVIDTVLNDLIPEKYDYNVFADMTTDISNEDNHKLPFTVENRNDRFIIEFYKDLDTYSMNTLNIAVQGFLFVKQLIIVFDLSKLEGQVEGIVSKLTDIIIKIKTAGGNVIICLPKDKKLDCNLIRDLNIEIIY